MELGKQIKKHRTDATLSQEELAEMIYVSRQTISNWENDKSYPDVNSLMLLSEVFQISLDKLIKGDIERMKREIDTQEYAKFQRDSTIFTVLFVAIIILPIPLIKFLEWAGIAIYLLVFGVGMYYALRVEKHKKKHDIQTYKEIIAFTEGKGLDEIEKAREEGKRPYQKILLAAGSALLAVIVALIIIAIIKGLS
ncbi:MAG TPA: XRE family transcriptional regulator [Ruminococcaceae bacterium]|jgi:transcriptional regulator with XRE-family HTH domain|nr:XRE family transcriptional regulator [Oscillospiraceae bacterium]HCA30237.1 XRE family transcriptional regulator [Oscillospiraceae bacterium]